MNINIPNFNEQRMYLGCTCDPLQEPRLVVAGRSSVLMESEVHEAIICAASMYDRWSSESELTRFLRQSSLPRVIRIPYVTFANRKPNASRFRNFGRCNCLAVFLEEYS